MADTLDSTGKYVPKDLQITSQPDAVDKDKFKVVVNNLKIDSDYVFQFQYVYPDGELSEWSPGYKIKTNNIDSLNPPKFLATDLTYFNGILNITWTGLDSFGNTYAKSFDRINVYIKDETEINSVYRLVGFLKAPGTIKVAVPPHRHSVKLTVVSVNGVESDFSTAQFETPILIPNTAPTSTVGSWVGTDFKISFTHNPSEEFFSFYRITLNAGSTSKVIDMPAVVGTSSQFFVLSLSQNRALFGVPQTSISGSVKTVNIYGNEGPSSSFSSVSYSNSLPAATISATAISNGYSVSYTTPTSSTFDHIEIEEVESSSSTAPSSGYTKVFSGSSNPAITITPNTNKRWIRARFVDNIGSYSSYGTAVSVTPTNPVVADTDGPADVSSVTTSGGLDNTGTVGFNGYADISWPAVSGGGIRGYRIRFRPVTTPASSYSYADSPGTGTSYRLAGLGAGLTYEIAVATYDEYNNTSSNYVAGSNVNVGGTPYIASTVDVTGYFKAKANPSDADSTAFKFGYGVDTGKRGLVFNANNYWYIDSSQTATLKVGGATTNYIEWNGSSFVIDGDLRAKKGSFSGNINMASGASIYSGTIGGNTVTATGDTGGSLVGAGYILNSSGLTFSSASVSGITTIDASTGLFTTASANIGGWNVNSSTINKTSNSGTVTLDSSNAQIRLSSSSYTAGLATPNSNSATDIIFWAGGSRDTNANFYVTADGTVVMKSAVITGYASANDISGLAKTDMSNVTTIDGGKITTGIIKSGNHSGPTDGSDYTTAGTAINLTNGTISAKKFRIDSNGDAFFAGTLSAGISITSPTITSGSFIGGYVKVTSAITSSGLYSATDSNLNSDNDQDASGTTSIYGNTTFNPELVLQNGKLSSNSILHLSGTSYTEILAGGVQAAMFNSTTSSMQFTTGLYLGNPSAASSASVQNHTAPWVNLDAKLRLRYGAPLNYPSGTPGAYVRNIYIAQRSTAPSATTGNVGDVFISY